MKNTIMVKILYLFLLLHPIMDLLTALMTRFELGIISVGIVIRGLFLLFMITYLFFFNSSKYKKKSIKYLLIIFIFCLIYFVTKKELIFNSSFFISELIYMFKYMYFPIIFICLINFFDQYKIDRKQLINVFIINLITYAILIIIPFLTNTGFNSYAKNRGIGVVGWFFSANEIGAILTIIFPLLFLYINKNVKFSIVISLLIVLFSVMLIGTKVAFFGCIGAIIVTLIYYLINFKKYKKMHFILAVLLLVFMFLISSELPVMKNINNKINSYNSANNVTTQEIEKSSVEKENTEEEKKQEISISQTEQQETKTSPKVILSSRDKLLSRIYNIYKDSSLTEKIFGIGFSNRTTIDSQKIEKIIEMDFFDIALRYGIIGLIIYSIPFVITAIFIIKCLISNKFKMTLEQYLFGYSILIGFASGFIAGHVFSSPPVSIYIALLMICCFDVFQIKRTKTVDKENIYFLSLHLGQGGIERATINTANALCEKKNVTIISVYKLDNNLYDIDPRINIKYLYNGGPNRDEWKKSIKDKNIIAFIKNSFKAVNILLKKKYLLIKEIKKIKSGIIISTTIDFSLLLNYYGNANVLKIVQEHRYHNHDQKYLRKMKYGYGNIDYIMALTKTLNKDYKELFKENTKIKVVTMPNMMSKNAYRHSTLDQKVVVSVSRLDSGKRVNEIIDIASKVRDMNYKFKIIGDGPEYNNLKKQIDDLNLNEVVELKGMLSNNDVVKELTNSSIYVMTSITEGFAIVLIEACSVGLPLVCYEIENDLSDIVKNNQNGYLIKNRDEKKFVEKLKLLMKDNSKRKIFGKKSVVVASNFSNEAISNKWIKFIDNASF